MDLEAGNRVSIMAATPSGMKYVGKGVCLGRETPPCKSMCGKECDEKDQTYVFELDSGEKCWGCECTPFPEPLGEFLRFIKSLEQISLQQMRKEKSFYLEAVVIDFKTFKDHCRYYLNDGTCAMNREECTRENCHVPFQSFKEIV